jgi:adiponectin receptor
MAQKTETKEQTSSVITSKDEELRPLDYCLHKYEEVPMWLQDNNAITDAYRVNFSIKLCMMSLFKLHNESWSIWTHTGAFALLFLVMIYVVTTLETWEDCIIFSIFLIGAQIQMLCSAVFHLFSCYSSEWYFWLAKLDYSGISIMIVASYYPPLYYGFACRTDLRSIYISILTVLGVMGLLIGFLRVFATPRFRVLRAVFYIIFGFYALIPLPHFAIINGWQALLSLIWREGILGALYIIGAVFYASRFPEIKFPGRFNVSVLSSHSIWHWFTIVAAIWQLYVCFYTYQFRLDHPCSL